MRPTVDILRGLNTATKYPSIPTYHALHNGFLDEERPTQYPEGTQIIGTEKVDGTNARMVYLPSGEWFIGSREELLYAGGDILHNPSQGIVEAVRYLAVDIYDIIDMSSDRITVVYGEVFGAKITGASKNYTTTGVSTGFRVFDIAEIHDADWILSHSLEWISGARERGELQTWRTETELQDFAAVAPVGLTPRIFATTELLPTTLADMESFLRICLPKTHVALDATAQGAAEGLVLRTPDRRVISKARFQDYTRTLRKMESAR